MAALVIYLLDLSESEFLERDIDREIARIAEEEKGDASIWITGAAYVKAEMSRVLLLDLRRTVPIAAAMLMLVSLFAFRNIITALIPLGAVGIALSWILAILAMLGKSLNVITVIIPPLILVVGFAYAMHVVSAYREVVQHGDDGASGTSPVLRAMSQVALPVLLSGLTTAAGFRSLATSPLGAIREFGLFATAGVAAAVFVAMTFAPAVLELLPPPKNFESA